MKQKLYALVVILIGSMGLLYGQAQPPKTQATIKPNADKSNCVDVYFKIDTDVSGYPGSVNLAFSMEDQSPLDNPGVEVTTDISSIQINDLRTTGYVRDDLWVHNVIFEYTGDATFHDWEKDVEYLLATVCFIDGPENVCENIRMVHYQPIQPPEEAWWSYWYMQMDGYSGPVAPGATGGDITDHTAPFYFVPGVNEGDNGNPNLWDYGYVELLDCMPLPIEMLSFTARAKDRQVYLDWATAQERNGSHFEVERSQDGRKWEVIEKVTAQGNTIRVANYNTIDTDPYYGISYYRLNKVDRDGASEYSEVRRVYIAAPNVSYVMSPNPASDVMYVEIMGEELQEQTTSIKLYNMKGEVALEQELAYSGDAIMLDLNKLMAGSYIAKIYAGSTVLYSQQIVVQ